MTMVLIPLHAYARKDDGHDWEYQLFVEKDDAAMGSAMMAEATEATAVLIIED